MRLQTEFARSPQDPTLSREAPDDPRLLGRGVGALSNRARPLAAGTNALSRGSIRSFVAAASVRFQTELARSPQEPTLSREAPDGPRLLGRGVDESPDRGRFTLSVRSASQPRRDALSRSSARRADRRSSRGWKTVAVFAAAASTRFWIEVNRLSRRSTLSGEARTIRDCSLGVDAPPDRIEVLLRGSGQPVAS